MPVSLTDFLVPPPLAALATMLLGLSLALISDSAGIRLLRRRDALSRGLYFFCGLLSLSWISLLLCICGVATQPVLQLLGIAIIASGCLFGWQRRRELIASCRVLAHMRGGVWIALLAVPLLLIALAPPTDADSLDYHLGVPLHVLRTGALDFDPRQLHFQMAGFGEMINLLGLANGCAAFGAFIQLLGLGWLLLALRDLVAPAQRIPALMLVLGLPALLALLPGSKHLLTGACCTTLCFLFLFRHGKGASARDLTLPMLGLAFAAGIKYSFFISAGLLAVYGLLRSRHPLRNALVALGIALIACGPLLLFRVWRFGDPVAPFGIGAGGSDPVVTWFCGFIRDYRETRFPFPLNLLVPFNPGALTSVLGLGTLIMIGFCILAFRAYRAEVLLIVSLCGLTLLLGQNTARFFIEPFMWTLPLWLRCSPKYLWARVLTRIGQGQFVLTLPLCVYLAWSLGRGVFSSGLQEAVMRRNASFYEPAEWVNAVVPHDALLLTDIRSRSLLKMPVFPIEYHYARNAGPGKLRLVDSLLEHVYDVRYIAVIDPDSQFVRKYCGERVAGPRTFSGATRNPFNRGTYSMVIYSAHPPARRSVGADPGR